MDNKVDLKKDLRDDIEPSKKTVTENQTEATVYTREEHFDAAPSERAGEPNGGIKVINVPKPSQNTGVVSEKRSRADRNVGIIFAAIAFVLNTLFIVVKNLAEFKMTPEFVISVLGNVTSSVIGLLILWGIIALCTRKKQDFGILLTGIIYFILILIGLMIGLVHQQGLKSSDDIELADEIYTETRDIDEEEDESIDIFTSSQIETSHEQEQEFAKAMIEILTQSKTGKSYEIKEINKSNYGGFVSTLNVFVDFYDEYREAVKPFEDIITNNKLENIKSGEVYSDINQIKQARQDMQSYALIIEKAQEDIYTANKRLGDRINNLDDAPQNFKDGFRSSYEATFEDNMEKVKAYFGVEKQIILKMDEIFGFLESKQGAYTFADGKVQFYDANDVDQYLAYTLDLQQLINKERDLKDSMDSMYQEKMNKLNDLIEE